MKTSHLLILSAAIFVFAAPAATARPVTEPALRHGADAPAVVHHGPAGIAAHHERVATEQWQRRQLQPGETLLVDRTGTDEKTPALIVTSVIALTLALVLAGVSGTGLLMPRSRRRRGATQS